MAGPEKGKFFALLWLSAVVFSCTSRVLASSGSVPIEDKPLNERVPEVNASDVLRRHQIQLDRLEELVRSLSKLVSRLESRLSEPPKVEVFDGKPNLDGSLQSARQETAEMDAGLYNDGLSVEKIGVEGSLNADIRDGEKVGAISVTKHNSFWSERFHYVSAVKLHSDATSINILPFRDFDGLSKYVAVGDDRGRVYVILRNGEVLVDFYTTSDSPVTAMMSYTSVAKNESVVITGHKNGLILVHRAWEASNVEEWSSLSMKNVGKFASPGIEDGGSEITMLELHYVGRMRYILSIDASGKIRVFRENGTVYGMAIPTSRPLAFLKQRLLFLTETGAGSLDLRTMKIRENECEGLNHSSAQVYVFDAAERSKAYGVTSEGDLIHVLLLGDIMNFKCRVRVSKKKFNMEKPLALQAIRGYLLILNQDKVYVYNVSFQHYMRSGGPRLLFFAGIDEIRYALPNSQSMDVNVVARRKVISLAASDREKLVVLSLGGGYVGMYRSNLPVFKGESNTILWTSPVFFFILFLFGAWQFFAKKKEVLTSWGPDDPFTSTPVSNRAPLGSGPGPGTDRPFAESSSRSGDIMELRGGGLRGPSRRYVSPPRYPGVTPSSFRPSSGDTSSRPGSVDPNLTRTSELKFRGSNVESPGFQKRRESLFVHSQVVEDNN